MKSSGRGSVPSSRKNNDMEVVAETSDISRMLDYIKDNSPNIVIMEIDKPSMNRPEAIRKVITTMPGMRLLLRQ
ncbi:MAG: hypothetical protein V1766_15845 [Pseudomonadota bacterium]